MEEDIEKWIEKKQKEFPELDKNLIKLAARIYFKIRDDWDMAMCVSGREGCGKSTFVYWICRLVDKNFNIKDNITYTINDFDKKLRTMPKYSAIWPDEGSDMFYKRSWNSQERTKTNQTLMMARQNNQFYAFCAPRMGDTDAYLREWRIRLWVHITDRGIGYVFSYDDNVMTGDPWHLGDSKLRKKRNMIAKVTFPDMPPKDKALYKQYKREYFDGERDNGNGKVNGNIEIKPIDKRQMGLMMLRRKQEKVTVKQLAGLLNVGEAQLYKHQRKVKTDENLSI